MHDSWEIVELSDVVDISPENLTSATPGSYRFKYIDIGAVDKGLIDWHGVSTQTFRGAPSRARRVVRANDVLLSTVRPGLQAHAFIDSQISNTNVVASTGFAVLRCTDNLYPRFLYHLVFSEVISRQLHQLETGSNYPAVNERDLAAVHFNMPSFEEQRRIAAVLDSADSAIQQTDALIAKLKQIKQGLLHDLLTRGIGPDCKLRDPVAHPEQFKEVAGFGRVPKSWLVQPLHSVGEVGTGLSLSKHRREMVGANVVEMPYLRVANVQAGYLDLTEIKTIRVTVDEIERYLLTDGDVLFTEGGDFDKLGRGTVWNAEIQPCLHQNHVFRVSVDRDVLLPSFLSLVAGSKSGRRVFIRMSKQTTNLASINSTQLKAFPVLVPSIDEQTKIIEVVDAHDTRIRAEEAYRDKLRAIKQGLMQDLLTGRVRV